MSNNRIVGAVMLLAGIVLAYLCIYLPVMEAGRGDHTISITLKGAVLCPVGIGLGLIYTIGGDRANALLRDGRRLTPFGWFVSMALFAGGIMFYMALKTYLEHAGYKFHN
jgi:hypothetical protein